MNADPSVGGDYFTGLDPNAVGTHDPAFLPFAHNNTELFAELLPDGVTMRNPRRCNAFSLVFRAVRDGGPCDVEVVTQPPAASAHDKGMGLIMNMAKHTPLLQPWIKMRPSPYVLRLFSVSTGTLGVGLVTDTGGRASLWEYVTQRPNMDLADLQLLAGQVARGLGHLHRQSPPIVHGNLSARSVRVIDAYNCPLVKIADFGPILDVRAELRPGQCKAYHREAVPSRERIRWAAPELLQAMMQPAPPPAKGKAQPSVPSVASDVWALGVTIWEAFSHGRLPYSELLNEEHVVHAVAVQGARLQRPVRCPASNWELVAKCFARSPKDRPTALAVSDIPDFKNQRSDEYEANYR